MATGHRASPQAHSRGSPPRCSHARAGTRWNNDPIEEEIIAGTVDAYYEALLSSTRGWHQQRHDPWPWLTYFVATLNTAYETFESRASSDRSTGTKQDRVRDYVTNHAPDIFKISDPRVALPGISDPTIRLALDALMREGRVSPDGTGRAAVWRKVRPTPQSR